jgi:hypothetical protein
MMGAVGARLAVREIHVGLHAHRCTFLSNHAFTPSFDAIEFAAALRRSTRRDIARPLRHPVA